jgi:hypothetical protein
MFKRILFCTLVTTHHKFELFCVFKIIFAYFGILTLRLVPRISEKLTLLLILTFS